MKTNPFKLVPPEPAAPVSIDAQWRAEVKRRDWGKVHIEGDRNEPIFLSILRKVHRL